MSRHPWQDMVHEFHVVTGRPVGDYSKPTNLGGALLDLRIRLVEEERAETMKAHDNRNLVKAVDGLCDLAYVTLGGFTAAGQVCRHRFGLLLSTANLKGWNGFTRTLSREIHLLSDITRGAVDWMKQCYDQGAGFIRWDLLDAIMVQLAHTCCATGLDIRPLFDEVHANNLTKKGGPIINGKICKPAGYVEVDLKPLLRAQGVGEEWLNAAA